MSDANQHPYVTRLNVQYKPLEVIEERELSDACQHPRYNQTLCEVNGSWSGWVSSKVNITGTSTTWTMNFSTWWRANC